MAARIHKQCLPKSGTDRAAERAAATTELTTACSLAAVWVVDKEWGRCVHDKDKHTGAAPLHIFHWNDCYIEEATWCVTRDTSGAELESYLEKRSRALRLELRHAVSDAPHVVTARRPRRLTRRKRVPSEAAAASGGVAG